MNRRPARPRAARALPLALALMAAGCAFDIDESPNLLPAPATDDMSVAPDAGSSACDCLAVGDWFRFTTLYPSSLGGNPRHPLVGTLKNLWARDIARYELNVIFVITAVSQERLSLRVLNGARGELGSGEICQLPETAVDLEFLRDPEDPCQVRMERPQSINIYAGSPAIPRNCAPALPVRHTIPVSGIQLQATISPDCSELSEGFAQNAGIPAAALPQICTCPGLSAEVEACGDIDPAFSNGACDGCNANFQNLWNLMVALNRGEPMPTDCPGEDGEPGVCIDAVFNGAAWPGGEPPECPADRVSLP